MKRIFKYQVYPFQEEAMLPAGANVVSAGEQGGDLFVWAEVDPDETPTPTAVVVAGTGGTLLDTEALRHVDTVVMSDGLVWHVYAERK